MQCGCGCLLLIDALLQLVQSVVADSNKSIKRFFFYMYNKTFQEMHLIWVFNLTNYI